MTALLNRVLVLALLVAVGAGQGRAADSAAAAVPPQQPKRKTIEVLVEEITKLVRASKTPGMSLAIVTKDHVLFAGGIGVADVANKNPATADTLFRIGSTSKAFTALAALKLQAQGRLDLNATFASLAPEIEFKNPWEATHPVRIVHLLEHTTGFDDIHLRDYANHDPSPHNLRRALAYDPDSRASRWPPGTRFSYCNAGPPMVAYVIEKITGEVFEDFVQREFFNLIGMTAATYFRPANGANLTQLYDTDGVTPIAYWHISIRPSGAINASAKDMAAYVRFYLNRGKTGDVALVSAADIERMERPESSTAARTGLPTGYGLYNATSFDEAGRVWHGHGGAVAGGACDMSYLPEAGVGYALMVNAIEGNTMNKAARLVRSFLTQDLAKPVPPAAVKIADDVAARHAGFYLPVSPRTQNLRFWLRLSGTVARLTFDDTGATFGNVLQSRRRLVGVAPKLLRRPEQIAASMVLLDPTKTDAAGLVFNSTSYQRVSAVVAFAPLALGVTSVIMALSTLVFLPIWLARAGRKKIAWRETLGLRLWPLAATLAVAGFAGAIALMFSDNLIIEHYGRLSVRAAGLAVASVVALLVPCIGLVAVLRGRKTQPPHRGLTWHAVLVLATLSTLALYLVSYGVIPLATWAT